MSDIKAKFESKSQELNTLQNELNDFFLARSQLETQFQENKIVLQEFDHLSSDSKIYKLTGPILLPQEYDEAKLNVNKRIEFIEEEIKRVEAKIADTEKLMSTARDQLIEIRGQIAAGSQ
jgi:prefoldin beta subunit